MRSLHLICFTASVLPWTVSVFADVAGSEDPGWAEPEPSQAFAALNRQGKPYPAFYRLYIRPHAVMEQDKLWCAYQDGEGRPLVTAYAPESREWSGPVRASDHRGTPVVCLRLKPNA